MGIKIIEGCLLGRDEELMSVDRQELLNQIINHKMLQKIFEAECCANSGKKDDARAYYLFSRTQVNRIRMESEIADAQLRLEAIMAQIAEEEDIFRSCR